ncbi:hypothetical protein BO83DRAFT_398825 [Aspergillus eucalypticola CBS 122712]|uniref:Rhodopsin domain-containing protein n=1 Tax=Aspergillus eucalypticola (strain CBS 122712 / IBT 29274) TaxID=1448314 RepID=A0A317VGB2_ASPEC|nr:uncharacterized protein BO83DRAFT_398825 [Aspergillus eucalypticola CBS 122712]PWY73406.1 hypothetical protein BO83DRAFT_398825 [Aspergillus eucalypticola CBS 122712]
MLPRSLEKGTSFTGQQTTVLGIGVAFMAFTSAVIALRVYVRTLLLRAWGADDVLMVIGTCIWATRLLYVLGLCFIKLSLLWFYLRLETRRFMLWLVYSVIFIVLGVSISSFFVDTISCIPPSKFWNSAKSGHCMSTASQQKFYEVNGILVIVMDILIWAVPIPMLWRVRISLRKKIAVLGVFSVGLLSIAAACVRYNTVLQLANNPDETYVLAASLNWCGIEAYVGTYHFPCLTVPVFNSPSVFYSTKYAKTSYYHIPSTLNLEDVQQILHNHSTLAHIFWPQLANDPENLLFENQTGPSTTEIQIRPASGSGPGPSGTKCKASITSHHEAREVVVAEEMPLGLRMTLVYRISDEPPQGISAEEGDGLLALADSQPSTSLSGTGSRIGLYVQVERSVMAPRPLSMLVKMTDGPIVKTKNLLFVLDELGNGKELDAALDALNELGESDDEGDEVLEKYKAD